MSAFGAEQLASQGINDLRGLAADVPNLNFGLYNGNAQVAIRGLGYDSVNPGAEGRVAVHLDGVYLSRPTEVLATFYDINRVEVLRGPQGTLYGRNATAGSVNIVTKDPTDELSGYVRQTVGNYALWQTEAAVGGGISNGISARLATQITDHGGYGNNVITNNGIDDTKQRSVRAKLRITRNAWDVVFSADYHREDDTNNASHFFGPGRPDIPVAALRLGGITSPDNRDIAQDDDPHNHKTQSGVSADATIKLGEVSLRSVSAYRYSRYFQNGTYDAVSGNFQRYQEGETSHQGSEELQLYNTNSGGFKWLLGAYYFHERIDAAGGVQYPGDLFGLPHLPILQGYFAGGNDDTDAVATFGQATWKLTETLSLTVGERVGWERKVKLDVFAFDLSRPYDPANTLIPGAGPEAGRTSDVYSTPKVNLAYQLGSNALLYATWAKGYKSGGFDLGGVSPAYRPEKLSDFEGGLKADWFDHRLRTNLSAFYYDYRDIQISVVRSTIIVIENAAKAKLYGVEAEITALPYDGLELSFNAGFLHSAYQDYTTSDPLHPELGVQNLAGNQMEEAPKFNSDLGVRYTWNQWKLGNITLRGDWRYKSRVFFTPFDNNILSQGANSAYGASLEFKDRSGRWTGSLWGKNLADKKVAAYLINSSDFGGYATIGYLDPPLTVGLTVGYAF